MTTSHTHACESKICPWQVAQFVILHVCILGICGVLLGALAVQFFGGEFPCPLCLLQRMAMILTLIGPVFIIVNAHRERMGGFSVWGLGFGMSIVAAVAGMAISTRQVLLHIAPGDPGYGAPVFGMHLYTWALVVFIVVIVVSGFMLIFGRTPVVSPDAGADEDAPRRLRWYSKATFWLLGIIISVNVLATFAEAGFHPFLPDNPDSWRLFDSDSDAGTEDQADQSK